MTFIILVYAKYMLVFKNVCDMYMTVYCFEQLPAATTTGLWQANHLHFSSTSVSHSYLWFMSFFYWSYT